VKRGKGEGKTEGKGSEGKQKEREGKISQFCALHGVARCVR